MRKIDLRPYPTHIQRVDAAGKPTGQKVELQMRESCVNLLFTSAHAPRQMQLRGALADRIDTAGDTVLLEETEWQWLVNGLDEAKLSGREFVTLIGRILDAPQVPVSERDPAPRPALVSKKGK